MARYTPLADAVDNARDFLDKVYAKEIQHDDGGFPLYMRADSAQKLLEQARSNITSHIAKDQLLAEFDAVYTDLTTAIRHTTRARERARSVTSARRAQIRSQK